MDLPLRSELRRRVDVDQAARKALTALIGDGDTVIVLRPFEQELVDTLARVDRENTEWLRNVIDRQGWPTRTLVGDDGARNAWLLAQHADRDPEFQHRCLALMTSMPADEIHSDLLAYLTDRVRLAAGESQVYGTQVEKFDGRWRPRSLADPESVNERRAAVGSTRLVPIDLRGGPEPLVMTGATPIPTRAAAQRPSGLDGLPQELQKCRETA